MPGRIRSTRRLRNWMIEQVSSEKYPGLVWDDEAKTMFRIPWKHAGKQDFRSNEDAAIFKAWAEFKGKLSDGGRADPASWKTRMRCALNKSPEFEEVTDRSQLDISEPYKVYRLVPMNEQGLTDNIKSRARPARRKRKSSESDSEEDKPEAKHMKEVITPVAMTMFAEDIEAVAAVTVQSEELVPSVVTMKKEAVDEIQLNFKIETAPLCGVEPLFQVSVRYLGREVLQRSIMGNDFRIAYLSSSPTPPTPPALMLGGFPRILLPEPSPLLANSPEAGEQLQALSTLLPYMEKGVMLTSTGSGIYARRYCQGRVFWTGPHTSAPGPLKMERVTEPVLLFSKDVFRQELDKFRVGGPCPQCGITLCFGEEFLKGEDPSSKLIISQITFPWAERQVQDVVQDACAFKDPMAFFHNLATQSPNGEVTLNLVNVPLNDQSQACGRSTVL